MNSFPPHVTLTEVGLRDGFQNESKPIPTSMKLDILARLIDAGIEHIQVTSFVSPRLVPQMADARELCLALPGLNSQRTVFSGLALNVKGVENAFDCGLEHVDISISADPVHSQKNTGMSLDDARKTMQQMIKRAHELNLHVHAGIQCAFGSAFNEIIPESRILDMTCEILDKQVDSFGLFDTTGMAMPSQIKNLAHKILPIIHSKPFFLHLHDTYGLGAVNLLTALSCGISRFDTAFGGLGGCPFIPDASGNLCTEDIVFLLDDLDIQTGIDIHPIHFCSKTIADYLEKTLPIKRYQKKL
ncbi:MAG: hydroxymethylglutaryl-CoA lyase [Candidatus Magnetomorum sp.]|nr:hydroxymethylglutaryl-CoA lyase [Candidatus Magnetomorum sp.]